MQKRKEKRKKKRKEENQRGLASKGAHGGLWSTQHTSHMDGLDLATLPLKPTFLVINTPTPLLVITIFLT